MVKAARLRRRLVDSLRRDGVLRDAHWIDAFREVPRHGFLPRFFIPHGDRWAAIARGDGGWLEATYSGSVLVTQLDDDSTRWTAARTTGPVRGTPTCSSSMPAIMAIMLEELLVSDGRRVLEIGSGTGYNAALLCQRLGASAVTTVDIDPVLAESAKMRLAECGFTPTCEVFDGARGFPPQAPFDRVLCTCAVSSIPLPWLEQTVPGGSIVATLNRPIGAALLRIVAGEGTTAQGRVLARYGRFMPMRAHRLVRPAALLAGRAGDSSGTVRTSLSLGTVLNPSNRFDFFASLELPGVIPVDDFLLHSDGSWARHHTRGDEYFVEQGGPRRLWDTVERGYVAWSALGEPTRDRFAITVTPAAQRIWLDEPGSPHSWPLAPAPET